jgi:RNA polymerase sigma-70 factor (ECF subfamily)
MNKARKIQSKHAVQLKVVQGEKNEKSSGKSKVTETITDLMLVERAVAGDGIAFSELVNRHYEKAVRVSFGMLKDLQDAEDVAQDAFVRVHRKLEGFQGQSAFSTWLYRIVVNLSIDLMRKKKRQRRADIDDEAARDALRSEQDLWPRFEEHDPSVSLERRELHKQLNQAFRELPDIHRAVLVLREVQGLSYDEIAAALEIKKGTVMSRLFHARKAMQVQMASIQKAEAKGGGR